MFATMTCYSFKTTCTVTGLFHNCIKSSEWAPCAGKLPRRPRAGDGVTSCFSSSGCQPEAAAGTGGEAGLLESPSALNSTVLEAHGARVGGAGGERTRDYAASLPSALLRVNNGLAAGPEAELEGSGTLRYRKALPTRGPNGGRGFEPGRDILRKEGGEHCRPRGDSEEAAGSRN